MCCGDSRLDETSKRRETRISRSQMIFDWLGSEIARRYLVGICGVDIGNRKEQKCVVGRF